ncbi:hypothetical protein BCV72DRAFT_255824 [Rhizopus microsporus var. microsporus]|uniref:Uncharacterized protein n=1 Tax=Rhizopus microsporus var. microsporus TaxID=86635 RepID=A0A1X0R684_RHIZD|nr:hypothetical protein BCV72DRAFT_255824 [Rhizopus microsporus var. microsporus]
MFLNGICKKKEESNCLRKKMTEERYADYIIQETIKRTLILPCMKVKLAVAKKQIPNDEILNADAKDQIKEFFSMYSTEYNFQKASIYYDVKANLGKHFKAFHKLLNYAKQIKLKTINAILYEALNYYILKYKNKKERKLTIWSKVINLEKKGMKNQGIGKTLQFEGTIETDEICASIIKQNFDTSRKRPGTDNSRSQKPKKTTIGDNNNVKHIKILTRTEPLSTNGRCVLIDPNHRDLLYCMKETSSAENKQILRFTSICRSKHSRRFRILRKKAKPEEVRLAEEMLSKTRSSAMNANIFLEHSKASSAFEDVLSNYDSHETKGPKGIYYPDLRNDFEFKKCNLYWGNLFGARFPAIFSKSIAIQDNNTKLQTYAINIQIISLLQTLQLLPFRKMRFSSKLLLQQNNDKLIKSLKKKFGHDAVLGLIQMLKKSGFYLYLINEYKISSLCPDCKGKLEKIKIIDNPRPYGRKDMSKVKCNGLLRKILMSFRETREHPSCFRQIQPLPKPSYKRRQGEGPSSNKRTKLSA